MTQQYSGSGAGDCSAVRSAIACSMRFAAAWIVCMVAALVLSVAAVQAAPSALPVRVVVQPADTSIYVGGDSNSPAVWVGDELRVFASNYPHNGRPGGAEVYSYGASLQQLIGSRSVAPDRSLLDLEEPTAFGPWFESVLIDEDGVLWAFYHAEFQNPAGTKIHPRIGMQCSRDAGVTWEDLGIVLDTPTGTDQPYSRLGYGFNGGNGDFSVIRDVSGEYLYFFFTQYGNAAENQGLAIARMLWAERSDPVGKVKKWFDGAWEEPGLGGRTTALLSNVGDAHGLRAPIDFWWGPSIHWNTHLERYVILLNRANREQWTYADGPANWFFTGTSLEDPSSWTTPEPIVYPSGYNGSWYPQVIGIAPGETDRLAGRAARLFVSGLSEWTVHFLAPGEPVPEIGSNPLPDVNVTVDDGRSEIEVQVGTALNITSTASDAGGDLLEHWLEIKNPNGVWSWEGWLTMEPWAGSLVGNGYGSTKSTEYTFTAPGVFVVRASAVDPRQEWCVSRDVIVRVTPRGDTPPPDEPPPPSEPPPPPPSEPPPPPVSPPPPSQPTYPELYVEVAGSRTDLTIRRGATLRIVGVATDGDGDLLEHWLEIQNPAGAWSWEGWLVGEPWAGALVGSRSRSAKTADFVFSEPGVYRVRTTAIDPHNVWCVSKELHILVTAP